MTPIGNPQLISHNTYKLLAGREWERYKTTDHVLMALLMGLRNAHFDAKSAVSLLRGTNRDGAQELVRTYGDDLDDLILSRWDAIEAKDDLLHHQVDSWISYLNTTFNIPRGGPTFRVALALSGVARLAGALTFTASVRQLTEIAGVGAATRSGASHKTTRAAIRRLIRGGWIRSEQSTHRSRTHQYTLVNSRDHKCPITPKEISNGVGSRIASPGVSQSSSPYLAETVPPYIVGRFSTNEALSEVFSPSGLGMNAFRAWICIREYGPMSTAALVAKAGIRRASADRAIGKLLQQDMIYSDPSGLWSYSGVSLESVEQALGLSRRAILRQQAFDRERLNFNSRFSRRTSDPGVHDESDDD